MRCGGVGEVDVAEDELTHLRDVPRLEVGEALQLVGRAERAPTGSRRYRENMWHGVARGVHDDRLATKPWPEQCSDQGVRGGRDRRRSGDPALFRRVLCRLSYPASRRHAAEATVFRGPDGI
jgi:hypothetical protein